MSEAETEEAAAATIEMAAAVMAKMAVATEIVAADGNDRGNAGS
jgi:hypothetical protein